VFINCAQWQAAEAHCFPGSEAQPARSALASRRLGGAAQLLELSVDLEIQAGTEVQAVAVGGLRLGDRRVLLLELRPEGHHFDLQHGVSSLLFLPGRQLALKTVVISTQETVGMYILEGL